MVTINKDEYSIEKPKLKEWLIREEIRRKLSEASEQGNSEKFLELYYSLVSDALHISIETLSELSWIEVAKAYIEVLSFQRLSFEFPMILLDKRDGNDEWNYEGRYWYMWLHLLAKNYNWSIEYVEKLDIDDAVALMHEISSDDFYNKEWEWGLSGNAYSYDPNTKTGKYNPLPKPKWMQIQMIKKELPRTKIRKDFMPVGVVVAWSNDAEHGEST